MKYIKRFFKFLIVALLMLLIYPFFMIGIVFAAFSTPFYIGYLYIKTGDSSEIMYNSDRIFIKMFNMLPTDWIGKFLKD